MVAHPLDLKEPLLKPNPDSFVCRTLREGDEFYDIFKEAEEAERAFWTPGHVDFGKDLGFWGKMSDRERLLVKHILAFFAASDGIVNMNLFERFASEVTNPYVLMFYGYQTGIETVHQRTYAILLETFVPDRAEQNHLFAAIRTMPAVRRKAEWALAHARSDARFAVRLAAFAFVEGVMFSASFAFIYWFKSRGVICGLTKSNEYIARDEGLHAKLAALLYRHYVKHKMSDDEFVAMARDAVAAEEAFVRDALPEPLLGMNADLMCEYVRYVAQQLAAMMGLKVQLFDRKCENPFGFMENIGTETKTNFHEHRPNEYAQRQADADDGFALDADI